jgi:hypothetical protein
MKLFDKKRITLIDKLDLLYKHSVDQNIDLYDFVLRVETLRGNNKSQNTH